MKHLPAVQRQRDRKERARLEEEEERERLLRETREVITRQEVAETRRQKLMRGLDEARRAATGKHVVNFDPAVWGQVQEIARLRGQSPGDALCEAIGVWVKIAEKLGDRREFEMRVEIDGKSWRLGTRP